MSMLQQQSSTQAQATVVDAGLRAHMLRIYNYMTSGLLLTGLVAYFAGTSPAFLNLVLQQSANGAVGLSGLGWLVALAPVGMVLFIGVRANAMSYSSLKTAFWGYAVLMGLSLFSIFLIYTGASIARVFFITAGTFGLMSIYGYSTKRDLTSWRSFLTVGVLAVFFVSIANVLFFHSSGLDLLLSYVGVFLAIGLTAYDTQKAKEIYYHAGSGGEAVQKASLLAALSLYFDFIYLFINLLRVLGDRR